MNEEQGRSWLRDHLHVPRETIDQIQRFLDFLANEASRQNLVSHSTLDQLWSRHVTDSAQLLLLARRGETWLDLGSGAGFPGLIIAALSDHPVTLVESRRKRVDFLRAAIDVLGLADQVTISAGRAETALLGTSDVITARAFAPLDKTFAIASRFAGQNTRWLLPKGRGAQAELDAARRTWQGVFRIEPSVTDPDSAIIVAEHVRLREQR